MLKKRQSRATKMVFASLLAAALTVPSFAGLASANGGNGIEATSEVTVTPINEAITKEQKVVFQTFKPGTTELQPAISNHLVPEGKIVEKDGKLEAQLTVTAKSAPMIAGLQTKQGEAFVDAAEVKNADGTITYSFPILADTVLSSKIHVVVPAYNMDVWYDFDLKAEVAKAEEVQEVAVTVYKDGTAEESIMKNYIASNVEVTKVDGKNVVAMTFPKGQYIQSFQVEGKDATLVKENKETNERTYSFEVADLKKLVNSQIHIIVNELGVNYDAKHKVQFGFAVEGAQKPIVNPFTDIDNDGNKDAILALLDKGIVKSQDKFNPYKDITRSQFALMVARALELKTEKVAGFQDIGNLDAERIAAINALADAGIVKKGEKFNPGGTLTRKQGALMIYRAVAHVAGKEVNYGDPTLPFYADAHTVTDEEAQKAFALLYTGKIMTGSTTADGKTVINANSPLKRTQMAKILNGSLQFMKR
ncbi:MAG: NEAT domain-containing protein [Lysinibacillus sp.]